MTTKPLPTAPNPTLELKVRELRTIEAWRDEKKTPDWLFAAAKACTPGWAIGRECDEKTYDAAVHTAGHLEMKPA